MQKLALYSPRLHIRNLHPDDTSAFHAYRSLPEVVRYQGFEVMDHAACAAFIASHSAKGYGTPGEWVQYAIVEMASGTLVGDCAIHLQADEPRIAVVGITISNKHWRKGYAKEALHEVMRYLFEEQQIHRIVETVDAENAASIALLKSLGFRQEGHFIENIFFKGAWGSEYIFAMLNREWQRQ